MHSEGKSLKSNIKGGGNSKGRTENKLGKIAKSVQNKRKNIWNKGKFKKIVQKIGRLYNIVYSIYSITDNRGNSLLLV